MPAPTTADLLWGTDDRPRRGPKPALSLPLIVDTAIALADAEGLANLTMQRLAERLGYTKMSVYRYVPGRTELLAVMLDIGMGGPPELTSAAAPQPWQSQLRSWAVAIHDKYQAHPWSIELSTGARLFGPNEMAWLDAALAALADTGLTGAERLDSVVLLNGHVRSLVQQTSAAAQPETMEQDLARILVAHGDRFPAVLAAFTDDPDNRDNALHFGIDRILDGLAALIAERRHEL